MQLHNFSNDLVDRSIYQVAQLFFYTLSLWCIYYVWELRAKIQEFQIGCASAYDNNKINVVLFFFALMLSLQNNTGYSLKNSPHLFCGDTPLYCLDILSWRHCLHHIQAACTRHQLVAMQHDRCTLHTLLHNYVTNDTRCNLSFGTTLLKASLALHILSILALFQQLYCLKMDEV